MVPKVIWIGTLEATRTAMSEAILAATCRAIFKATQSVTDAAARTAIVPATVAVALAVTRTVTRRMTFRATCRAIRAAICRANCRVLCGAAAGAVSSLTQYDVERVDRRRLTLPVGRELGNEETGMKPTAHAPAECTTDNIATVIGLLHAGAAASLSC